MPAKYEPEAAAEDEKPKNGKKKPGKQQETEDSKNDEDVLSHVDHRKRQEVEDVEQLRDIRSGFAQLPFAQWCKNRMSKHELSSSYNPQSNGHAEQAVNTVKGILKKTDTKQWSPPKPDPELVRTVRAAKLDKSGQGDDSTLDLALQEIMDIADKDGDYQLCYKALSQHKQLRSLPRDHPAQKLSTIWDALSIENELPGLMLYHGRVYIPQGAVESVLKKLHIQHTAFDKTSRNARSL